MEFEILNFRNEHIHVVCKLVLVSFISLLSFVFKFVSASAFHAFIYSGQDFHRCLCQAHKLCMQVCIAL